MCAKILREQGNYNQSIEIFKNIIKKNPSVDFLIELSLSHIGNNESDQAENILNKILEFKPKNKPAKEILEKLHKSLSGKENIIK